MSGAGAGKRADTPTVELGPERPATAMDAKTQPANNSPILRADPTDARFVVLAHRVDAPEYVCRIQLSGDSGGTWVPAYPVPVLPERAEKCFGGEVAFDRSGRLHYVFVGLVGQGNEPMGVFLTTSADRGRTFSPPRQILGPLNFAVRMAIDATRGSHGRLHLVWLHATSDPPAGGFGPPPNPIMAAHSDDGGTTFSKPVQVSDVERQRVVAPALALGSDGRVHVAYYDLLDDARDYQGLEGPVWDGKWALMVSTSANGGRTFGAGVAAEPEVTPPSRVMAIYIMPPAAIAATGRFVCVGWSDARNGDPDVLVRCSQDRGQRWDEPQRVNDDPVGTGRWQYLPGLSIAPRGRVDVIFYDRRRDLQNINNDVLYTFSDDRGESFHQNVQLNREGSSLSQIGVQYTVASAEGQWDFGSRIALLSQDDRVVAAWTDTRNSVPHITGQDVFTTVVRLGGLRRDGTPASAAGGLLLLVSGLAGLVVVTTRSRKRA